MERKINKDLKNKSFKSISDVFDHSDEFNDIEIDENFAEKKEVKPNALKILISN